MMAAVYAVLISLVVAAGFVVIGYYKAASKDLPPPEEMMARHGGGARILDRNGQLLCSSWTRNGASKSGWSWRTYRTGSSQATRRRRSDFYSNPHQHQGCGSAAYENLIPGDKFFHGSGGSSITQQLVKLVYLSPEERASRTNRSQAQGDGDLREMTRTMTKTRSEECQRSARATPLSA
jgi:hypothetical protein